MTDWDNPLGHFLSKYCPNTAQNEVKLPKHCPDAAQIAILQDNEHPDETAH